MNLIFRVVLGALSFIFPLLTNASPGVRGEFLHEEGLFRASDGQKISVLGAAREVQPGSIVVIGENHGLSKHQGQQLQFLQALRLYGRRVSVGMEFFSYIDQVSVDQWRQGVLSESDFLKGIGWGQPSFDFYRPQATFPDLRLGEGTLALNAPRKLTGRIAKAGLENLTPEEKTLLPPNFTLGRDSYKQRFTEMMPHLPPGKVDNYFAAQSAWDDTMAWRAVEFIQNNPHQVLVIIVGEFHVQYGGGLVDRIQVRSQGLVPIHSISQISRDGLTEAELAEQLRESPMYGLRANWLWVE